MDLNFRISNETLDSGLGLDSNLIRREGSLFVIAIKPGPPPVPHSSVLGESIIISGEKQQSASGGLSAQYGAIVNT